MRSITFILHLIPFELYIPILQLLSHFIVAIYIFGVSSTSIYYCSSLFGVVGVSSIGANDITVGYHKPGLWYPTILPLVLKANTVKLLGCPSTWRLKLSLAKTAHRPNTCTLLILSSNQWLRLLLGNTYNPNSSLHSL